MSVQFEFAKLNVQVFTHDTFDAAAKWINVRLVESQASKNEVAKRVVRISTLIDIEQVNEAAPS
jgi:cell fate regulator YaaT (PSP1 superfamily)